MLSALCFDQYFLKNSNSLHTDYKLRDKRNLAMNEIAEALSCPVKEATDKIHKLRVQFAAETRKIKSRKSGQGTSDNYESKWAFYDSMKFTGISSKPKKTQSNVS